MDCSIVIPHKDRSDLLAKCLASLCLQKTNRPFEVIVVDDGSKQPPGPEIIPGLSAIPVRFLFQKNKGRSHARNVGWRAANGDIIVFLDGDQLVKPDFVERHCAMFDQTTADILQFGLRKNLNENALIDWKDFEQSNGTLDPRHHVLRLLSCNMASIQTAWHLCFSHNISVRRQMLEQVGGFNPDFLGWGLEDCEFAYRCVGAGARVVFNPLVKVFHQFHADSSRAQRFEGWLKNLSLFESIHPQLEIRLQRIFSRVFNPAERLVFNQQWPELFVLMETMSRIANPRPVPGNTTYTLVNPTLGEVEYTLEIQLKSQIAVHVHATDSEIIAEIQLNPLYRDTLLYVSGM